MTDTTIEQPGDAAPAARPAPAETRHLSPARVTALMALLLLAVTLLIYLWGTPPALWGDDWALLRREVVGNAGCAGTDLRPLWYCWMWGTFALLGTNIMAVQVATVLLSALLALLLFLVLQQLLPAHRLFNFGVALLFLLYPTDYVHNWIIGGNIRVPLILFMLTTLLLVRFWRGGSRRQWAAAMLVLTISLFVYELHMGLMALVAGLLFLHAPALTWRDRVLLLVPFVIMGAYSVWRWQAQLQVPEAFGHDTADVLALTPQDVVARAGQTLRVSLWEGWQLGVARALGGDVVVWLLPLVMVLLLAVGLWWLYRRGGSAAVGELPGPRQLLALLGLGLLLMVAASFPGLLVNEASLHFERTRFNILPSLGAALALAALLALVAKLLAGRRRPALSLLLFGLLLVPFLLLSGGVQRQVNADFNVAWDTHKALMTQLFALAPDVADGTNIIVTLPLPEPLPLGPKPIASGVWGFSTEMSVMYDRNLQASFRWGRPDDLNFTPQGVRLPGRGVPIAYERVLIFHYDGEALHHIRELPQKAIDIAGPQELCPECVLPGPPRSGALRYLLE